MTEVKGIKWPLKDIYAENLGCPYWPYPILKGWIPCRFPALKLAGIPPCDLCWRKIIYNALIKIKGGETK